MFYTPLLTPSYRRPAAPAGRRYLFSKAEFTDRHSILPLKTVAVLFARRDSVYKDLVGADVYDIDRDARTYAGDLPIVAHPPCRAWGRLRQFAKPRADEKDLAFFAVERIRQNGGVLEHPERSTLWQAAGLPLPGEGVDAYGGFSFAFDQHWFGHRARKRTWLYIVGIAPRCIPDFPISFTCPSHVIAGNATHVARGYQHLPKAEKEHTPAALAKWLFDLAQLASKKSGSYVTPGQTATGGSNTSKITPGQTLTCEQNHD